MREMTEHNAGGPEEQIGEILSVLRLCHPEFETCRGLTFSAGRKDPVSDWNHWCGKIFLPKIATALVTAREFAAVDQQQEDSLPDPERTRSRDAGQLLLLGFTVPPGARVLQKIRALHEIRKTPGHFSVIYGIRCALFNIPPRAAVLGYLYVEWQTGTRWSIAPRHMPDFSSLFEDIHTPASPQKPPNPLFSTR